MEDAPQIPEKRFSIVGLVVAALLVVAGVGLARESWVVGLVYLTPALALGIRSFLPGMTFGRGFWVFLGGMGLGMLLLVLMVNGFDDPASIVGPGILAGAGLWTGFGRGKIKWKKEKPLE